MACSLATLSLCSSFAAHCNVTSRRSSLSKSSFHLAKPLIGFLAPSTSRTSVVASRFAEPAAVEAQPVTTDIEALVVSEDKPEQREEVFAVVMIGGRQYIVFPGRYLYTQRLKDAEVDDQIVLNKVLLVGTKTHSYIGKPVVTNATVHAVVESQGLNEKVVVFKYKPKKKYRRNIGHRQPNTRLRITGITGYEEYPASPNVTCLE